MKLASLSSVFLLRLHTTENKSTPVSKLVNYKSQNCNIIFTFFLSFDFTFIQQQKQDPLEDIQAILGQCADKLPAEERADSGLGLYSDSGSEFGRRNSDENESRPCSSARSLSQNTSAGDSIGSSRSASGRPSPSPSPSTSLANVRPAAMMSAEGPGAAVGDGSFADDGSGRKTTVTEHEIAEEEREGILAEEFVELLQECYKLQQELNDRINSSSSASTRHHGGVAGLGPKPNLIV